MISQCSTYISRTFELVLDWTGCGSVRSQFEPRCQRQNGKPGADPGFLERGEGDSGSSQRQARMISPTEKQIHCRYYVLTLVVRASLSARKSVSDFMTYTRNVYPYQYP